MQNINERAQNYLNGDAAAEKVFSTADGQLFTEEMYARQHAAVLEDKEVVKHVREVVIATAVPAAEVKVQTKNENGDVIREYNQTVELPKITDAPDEVDGKVDVITEGLANQAEAAKEAVKTDPAQVDDSATQGTAKAKATKTVRSTGTKK